MASAVVVLVSVVVSWVMDGDPLEKARACQASGWTAFVVGEELRAVL